MENIINTTKYIKAIQVAFIAVAFTIVLPTNALAQWDGEYWYDDVIDSGQYGGTNVVLNPIQNGGWGSSGGTNVVLDPIQNGGWASSGGTNIVLNPIQNGGSESSGGTNVVLNPIQNGGWASSGGTNVVVNPIQNGGWTSSGGTNVVLNPIQNGGFTTGGNNAIAGGYPSGGTFYNNTYSGYGGYYAGINSGGYTASNSTYTPASYTAPSVSGASSGVYTPGNSNYTDPSYSVPQTPNIIYGNNYNSGVSLTSQVIPNQVLAYTDTNSSLDSVYLSDIPATGFSDYYGILMFISILISWSAILAYVFLKRKIESQTTSAIAEINKTEIGNIDNHVTSNLLNKITSDNSDIKKVEEYARINKVLLSSDASVKIVKLSRLGQINASEYIRSIAKGEWIAVGINQIA
jgi:hypothetical protein